MVYLPVNAIGLPLSFLLRPGFLLLGRRERVLGESEDVLGIHGRGFEKLPRIRVRSSSLARFARKEEEEELQKERRRRSLPDSRPR